MHTQPKGKTSTDPQEIVDLIPALRAFARSFCKDPNDADDLVQETLTKGLAKLDSFEPGTRLKSWLFTIMRNAFYNRVTVYVREAPGTEDCVSATPACGPGQEWSVRASEMRRAIERLPEAQKEMLVLVGLLGTSYKDAARICRCDIGTVKSRLSRSRTTLLAELGETSSTAFLQDIAG